MRAPAAYRRARNTRGVSGATDHYTTVGGAPVYDTTFDDERRAELGADRGGPAQRVAGEGGCRVTTALAPLESVRDVGFAEIVGVTVP